MALKISTKFALALITVAISLSSNAANAGFEWIPDKGQNTQMKQIRPEMKVDEVDAVRVETSNDAQRSVVINWNDNGTEVQQKNDIVKDKPSKVAVKHNFTNTIGFGNDMPLALGLMQVVPSEYVIAYEVGVDAGAKVSWSGDRPWNEVVKTMLQPYGYSMSIRDNKIMISNVKTAI